MCQIRELPLSAEYEFVNVIVLCAVDMVKW